MFRAYRLGGGWGFHITCIRRDDSDLSFDDYAGYFYLDEALLRDVADCGEVVYFYSDGDMDSYETRVNGFAVDVVSLD